ncbi:nicotinamide-nucleotide amidohydrolase family protein [Clostridium sp. JN-9]|nr:nicotinamide-nucleotide amidohydrolase family protein [Clostridium sp. JN-9]
MSNEKSIENEVGQLLIKKHLTVSTAESCTGGLLAAALINYPGISSCFMEGAVTYSNEAKVKRLNVNISTLEQYGAVSDETAREMAYGIAMAAGTDIGISTTGIAGPGGGTKEKPVGLVYIGLYINKKLISKKLNLSGTRQSIRRETVNIALNMLKQQLSLQEN